MEVTGKIYISEHIICGLNMQLQTNKPKGLLTLSYDFCKSIYTQALILKL